LKKFNREPNEQTMDFTSKFRAERAACRPGLSGRTKKAPSKRRFEGAFTCSGTPVLYY
jgi:hypothetical protein